MPCSDTSSSIALRLDPRERFVSFNFAKITCGKEIGAQTGYSRYCEGKDLREILGISYEEAAQALKAADEERRFILYLEWDALRSAAAQYLGMEDDEFDGGRCQICAVTSDEDGIEISLIILPPKEMPKILPCSLAERGQ